MDIFSVFDVFLVNDGFLWSLSTKDIAMLPCICRASGRAYWQNMYTVWCTYAARLDAHHTDELLARMFGAKPVLAMITYRARGQVFVGVSREREWEFPLAAAKAGFLRCIRDALRHVSTTKLTVMLVSSNDNSPREWVWWATALIERPAAQGTVKNYLTISLLSVECFDDDELHAICAHMRYMVDTNTIYRFLRTVRDDDNILFRPRLRNLCILLEALEVRLGWRDEEFRKALRGTISDGNIFLFFGLAQVSGYHEDRSIQFAIRKEIRGSGHDPKVFDRAVRWFREKYSRDGIVPSAPIASNGEMLLFVYPYQDMP